MGFAQKPLFFFVQSVSVVLCPRDSANRLGMPGQQGETRDSKSARRLRCFLHSTRDLSPEARRKGCRGGPYRRRIFPPFHTRRQRCLWTWTWPCRPEYHALREEAADWLVMRDEAEVAHHFAPETRIEQVQNGVRDAADVLVNREPVSDFSRVKGRFGIVWIAVPVEIPRRIHKRVHRVCFAARGTSALGDKSR